MFSWQNKSDNDNNENDQDDRKPSAMEKHETLKNNNRLLRVREPFLDQLEIMLNQETDTKNDISGVQWRETGDGFIITDQNKLQDELIPKYFDKPIIFQSFVRKLYRWGFHQIDTCNRGRYEFVSNHFKRTFFDKPSVTSTSNDDQFSTHQDVFSLSPASSDTRFFPLNSRTPQQIFDESFSNGASIINHDMGITSGVTAAAQSITNTCINRPQNQLDFAGIFEASRFSTKLCDSLKIDDIHTRLWVAKLYLEKSPPSLTNQNASIPSSQETFERHSSKPAAVAASATSDLDLCSASSEYISGLFHSMIENYSDEVVLAGRAGIGLHQHKELRMGNQQCIDESQQLQNHLSQQEDFADFVKKLFENKLRGQETFDVPSAKTRENLFFGDQTQCPSQKAIASLARSTTNLIQNIDPCLAAGMNENPNKQLIPTRQHSNPFRTSGRCLAIVPRELLRSCQWDSSSLHPFATTRTTRCLQSLLDENLASLVRRNSSHGSYTNVGLHPNQSPTIINNFLGQGDSAKSFQLRFDSQLLFSGIHPQNEGIQKENMLAIKHQVEQNQERKASSDCNSQQINRSTSLGQSFSSPSSFESKARTNIPSKSKLTENIFSRSNAHFHTSSHTWNGKFQSNVDRNDDDDDDDVDNFSTKRRRR